MMYKLFLFGEKELFALVDIPQDMNLKEGDLFNYQDKRYKILRFTRVAIPVQYDETGKRIRSIITGTDKEREARYMLPELLITESPKE